MSTLSTRNPRVLDLRGHVMFSLAVVSFAVALFSASKAAAGVTPAFGYAAIALLSFLGSVVWLAAAADRYRGVSN